jgi:spermidine dehydrogenase
MEDVVTARFDYSQLDRADSPVRLRLNSTVTRVQHHGEPRNSKKVALTYIQDGKAFQVQARSCILACNNAMIPYIAPDLPETQREALAGQVRTPNLYTNVALGNWRAWKKLGMGAVSAPNGYHANAMLDFPVSLGGYNFSGNPDEPIIVHMERFPHRNNEGLNKREQFRLGRYELLSTPYATIERHVRQQLADILAGGGFDPARDIEGITVNRWAHGYSYYYDWLEDPWYEDWDDERYPHVRARKPFGRVAIANSDAGASADFDTAVVQAYRAVSELE